MLAKPLAACTHLSSTVSQLFELQVQIIAVFTYRSPHFCFPWRRPCDYHAICCMDGKTIQCLPNLSQHVLIYPQQFPSYSNRKCKNASPLSARAVECLRRDAERWTSHQQRHLRMEQSSAEPCQSSPSVFVESYQGFAGRRCGDVSSITATCRRQFGRCRSAVKLRNRLRHLCQQHVEGTRPLADFLRAVGHGVRFVCE